MTTTAAKTRRTPGPTRGGDGGVYRAPPEPRHWRDNGKIVLTGAADDGTLVSTIDPDDLAHLVRQRLCADHGPMTPFNSRLADPDMVRLADTATPRRYHRSQVTSRGMPYDSMYDHAAAVAARLQRDLGIDLGWRTCYPRCPRVVVAAATTADRARLFAGLTARQTRDLVTPKTRQRCTRREAELSAMADALIRSGEQPKTNTRGRNQTFAA